MHQTSTDFSGLFRLKGKSHDTFDTIMFTKSVFFFSFNFGFAGVWRVAAQQLPPPLVTERTEQLDILIFFGYALCYFCVLKKEVLFLYCFHGFIETPNIFITISWESEMSRACSTHSRILNCKKIRLMHVRQRNFM